MILKAGVAVGPGIVGDRFALLASSTLALKVDAGPGIAFDKLALLASSNLALVAGDKLADLLASSLTLLQWPLVLKVGVGDGTAGDKFALLASSTLALKVGVGVDKLALLVSNAVLARILASMAGDR